MLLYTCQLLSDRVFIFSAFAIYCAIILSFNKIIRIVLHSLGSFIIDSHAFTDVVLTLTDYCLSRLAGNLLSSPPLQMGSSRKIKGNIFLVILYLSCTQNIEKLLIIRYIQSMKTCPRCGSKKWWLLSAGQIRCSQCGLTRKISKNIWKRKRISPYWKGRLIEYFCLGVPAYRLRFQVPYSQLTIQRCFRIFRESIYRNVLKNLQPLSGEIEMDETMFSGRRPGKRG